MRIVHTYDLIKTIKGTARQLGLSVKVVKKWVRRHESTQQVERAANTRTKPVMTPLVVQRALTYLQEGSTGAAGVARRLHEEGFTPRQVHKTTVIRAAKQQALEDGTKLRALTGKPMALLSVDTKLKRLSFAKANLNRDWTKVMFTDWKKFLLTSPGSCLSSVTWVTGKGERRAVRVTHPVAVNVYAGISIHGVTKCRIVAGTTSHKSLYSNKKGAPSRNITSAEYQDVLTDTLLPEGDRLFGGKGVVPVWVFQQDNDPTHRVASQVLARRNRERLGSVKLLENWPPNSPDLNLIENLWAYVSRKIKAKGCRNITEFRQTVLDEMKAVPKAVIQSLFDSMPKRMGQVIEKSGEKTGY